MLRLVKSPALHLWRKSSVQCIAPLSTGQADRLKTSQADRLKEGDTARLRRSISRKDVRQFSELVGDNNPVHEDIVHGTLLLGLVSGVMATSLPGPGSLLTSLTVKFSKPCYFPATVEVLVELGPVRKITRTKFSITDSDSEEVLVRGEASCYLSPDQLQSQ